MTGLEAVEIGALGAIALVGLALLVSRFVDRSWYFGFRIGSRHPAVWGANDRVP